MGGTIEGVGIRLQRPRGIRLGWWLAISLPPVLMFALCFRPVMRLVTQKPASFAEERAEWDATRLASEEREARAYWQVAVNIIQWQYPFGTNLPDFPVPEFKLDERLFPHTSLEAGAATRTRYWAKLQEAWIHPQSWKKTYVWNPSWLAETLSSLVEGIWRYVSGIIRRLGQ